MSVTQMIADESKTPPAVVPKGLVAKLCQIMGAVGYVEKRGINERFNYKYATEADLVNMLRGELASRNIFIFPSVISVERKPHGEKMHITDAMIRWTFVDGDTGETHECMMPGCGTDSQDKGIYKAITGSEKYLLMKAFLIPTGDDPEAESDAKRQKANGAAQPQKSAQVKESAKESLRIILAPGKQGFRTITGNGLSLMLTKLFETEKTSLGLVYDGSFWTVPILQAFRFADACAKHGVGVVHIDSGVGILHTGTNPNAEPPQPAAKEQIIKGVFPKSGEFTKGERKGQKWELRQVIWGDSRFICWDKNLWPILEGAKGKKAVLSAVEPVQKGKDGLIDGVLRIEDTEYEVIEEKTVPIIRQESFDRID